MNRNFNGQNNFNGGGQAPDFNGGQAPDISGGQAPQMWGNENSASEIFQSNNFSVGAPNDLNEITFTSGNDAFFETDKQNNFGGFAQGNMMPPAMFGGQGGQFGQAQQPHQNQFK
ncbi:MAG: hypothetical protein IKI08_00265 [Selenomonadaceae bacterium]|nr:hypothetical protein [Selenomonadaceae bacterium]